MVVAGKSGNAPLRTQAGVYCNVRPYGCITVVRCMPCLPYSQDRSVFDVNAETGIIHSEMNTPGVQLAYANRRFLEMIHQTRKLGRVAYKPTQAQEDGINSGAATLETPISISSTHSAYPRARMSVNSCRNSSRVILVCSV